MYIDLSKFGKAERSRVSAANVQKESIINMQTHDTSDLSFVSGTFIDVCSPYTAVD